MQKGMVFVLGLLSIFCFSQTLIADNGQLTVQKMSQIPLAFTENKGQWDEQVFFRANAGGATMWFTKEGVTYQFTRRTAKTVGADLVPARESGDREGRPYDPLSRCNHEPDSIEQLVITAKFIDANANPEVVGEGQMEYKCNYFLGNDPTKWHADVPNYEAITLKDIYPGIDIKYSGDGTGQAAYEFIVAPIKVAYEGAEETSIDSEGRMILRTKWGDQIAAMPTPTSNDLSGTGSFSQLSEKRIGFKAADANRQALGTLSVGLVYSTYLGGSGSDWAWGIAVDDSGNAYVAGSTSASDFPIQNPYQSYQGGGDVFVTKLSSSGNSLIYSTYLGGSSADEGNSVDLNGDGNAYVTGVTSSSNFPALNPYQTLQGYADAFVTKLSSSGDSLIGSTYLGGSDADAGLGIAVDSASNIYVMALTWSSDFPTQNPYQTFQGGWDASVTKLSELGQYLCGDANGNEVINLADIAYLVGYIFLGGSAPDPLQAGDVNCSGQINLTDCVYLIGYIFLNGPEPCAGC